MGEEKEETALAGSKPPASRNIISLAKVTESMTVHDKDHGKMLIPTTLVGNRSHNLFIAEMLLQRGKEYLADMEKDKTGYTPSQFKQITESIKMATDMTYEAHKNPEQPGKESSPITEVKEKLRALSSTPALPGESQDIGEGSDTLADLELVSEEPEEPEKTDDESDEDES